MRTVVTTDSAPVPVGPYSQAIRANGLVFLAGQIALDPATGQLVAGDISVHTQRVLTNVTKLLEAAGSSLDKVVRCVVYLKDIRDFSVMNDIYSKHFADAQPVRTTIEAANLPRGSLIEIEVTALE
jgi:2-iminobutanoate/2-iminopropanoate deaminase